MSYRIGQDFEYTGNKYWRWWAWIDADQAELEDVTEVVWILHPSFKRTRVVIRDRSNNFRLETAGWGTFLLKAEVVRSNGEKRLLRHNLRLELPEESDARSTQTRVHSKTDQPSIFLSYSSVDARAASKLRSALEGAGLTVLDQSQLTPGEPWSEALEHMIARSDAVVGLVGEDEVSPWVSAEMNAAYASAKPTVALVASGPLGPSVVGGLPNQIRRIEVDVNKLDQNVVNALLKAVGSMRA